MPAPATIDELVDLGQKSGILDRKGLDDYLQRVRSGPSVPTGPQDLAAAMVRDGLLTRFQADQLLQGRWRNFLIGGKYKLLERIGAGGMGAVFLCEHMRLKRRVAVKVLPSDQAQGDGVVERFEREARAVAALDHPNIVKIHDVDHDGKLHYLVMEYVDGNSLQDIVKKKGPLDILRACHYVFQACLGLQHAHDKGLVHRDIKPGNILLDRSGIIKILDLGLARFFNDQGDNLTREHDATAILGTADYLAPEQASDSHNVDARADIYSLGMTFYFLLAGKAPFAEGTLNQKLIWHQVRNPELVTNRRPDLPPEVVAILGRMIEKDPGLRFQSASEVAEALASWVQTPIDGPPEDEMPELSRAALGDSPGSSGVTRSPVRHSIPTTPPLRPGGATPTTSGTPKSDESARKPRRRRGSSDRLGKRGTASGVDREKVLLWARFAGYGLVVLAFLGILAWWAVNWRGSSKSGKESEDEETSSPRANTFVPRGPGRPGGPQQSLFNLSALGEIGPLKGHTGPVERVAFSPDGHRAVTGSLDKTVRIWSADTGEMLAVSNGHPEPVHDVAFSPDGRFVLSASSDRTARMWDAKDCKPVRTFAGHTGPVNAVAISADGQFVATGAGEVKDQKPNDCSVRLWDANSGGLLKQFDGHTAAVRAVAFSPDGQRLLSGSDDHTARIWDLASGKEVRRFTGHNAAVRGVAFAPDGMTAASAGADRVVRLWATTDGKEKRALTEHTASVAAVAFSPDGQRLLSGSDDRTMRLWETASGKQLNFYTGHGDAVRGVCFSPDGKRALSASADHTAKEWGLSR